VNEEGKVLVYLKDDLDKRIKPISFEKKYCIKSLG
jgi:hypothetical protein